MKPPRFSAVQLLVALGLLFVTAPFVEVLPQGDFLEVLLVTLVMVAALVAVGESRRSLSIALLLLTPALAGKWINHLRPDLLHPAFFLLSGLAFFAYVVAQLLRFIVCSTRVDGNVLCAGVSGFLLLGLTWAPAYLLLTRLDSGAFTLPAAAGGAPAVMDAFDAFYFSFVTLCTVGYGDIVPVSNPARMLAVLEGITGLLYMAVLISRLVSLHASTKPATDKEPN